MATNVIHWRRVVSLYKTAIDAGATHADAVAAVAAEVGISTGVAEWCVAHLKPENTES